MNLKVFRTVFAALSACALLGTAHAQDHADERRMAEAIVGVCFAAMRSGEAVTLEQFGDQFVSDGVDDGVTRLRQARGQPWVRLRINGSRPGACGASFSNAGPGDSFRTATYVADEISRIQGLREVSIPAMRQAFTLRETPQPFDYERHSYIAYVAVAGYQTLIFMPAASEPAAVE